MTVTLDQIRAVPKVLLHDHLDGGLRPATIIELARAIGYADLPSYEVEGLTRAMTGAARRGHLELYLEPFRQTVAVMQTPEALTRVAAECAEDLAADGVVYAEVRFAPELHLDRGLRLDQGAEAVLEGFRQGSAAQARAGRTIVMRALLTAMRTTARSLEIAELAVRYRDLGVVGFDIAGAEAGGPPSRPRDAFEYVQRENFHITIHAGEGFGLPSIWEAVQFCGAERLGHGVRIVDDIKTDPDGSASLGRLASFVRDRRIALELCPTSNVQTGAAPSIAEHPIGLLRELNFRVTVNTDNRLMSGITLSSELHALTEAFGYGWADLQWLTINAMKSAFVHFDERLDLIHTVIKPGYAPRLLPALLWPASAGARRGSRRSAGRQAAVMASTTITLTVMAWAAPPEKPPEWKYTVVTTAEPMPLASCWIALSDPLALPASPAAMSPSAMSKIVPKQAPMPRPVSSTAGASVHRLSPVPSATTRTSSPPAPAIVSSMPIRIRVRPSRGASAMQAKAEMMMPTVSG